MNNDGLSGFDVAILLTDDLTYARAGAADRAITAQGLGTSRKTAGTSALDRDAIERFGSAPAQARQEAAR